MGQTVHAELIRLANKQLIATNIKFVKKKVTETCLEMQDGISILV
jgi:hypothetical protein